MIPHRDSTRAALTLALVALALFGATAASTTVAAQGDQPTVRVGSATVTAGGTVTVDVVLSSAPDGLAGYLLEFSVEGDAARVESVSYPERFGVTTDPDIEADGRTATAEAADLEGNVQTGATDVTLATVRIAGTGAGEATLTVEPVQFDADGGASFRPATQAGTLTIESAATTTQSDGDVSTPAASGGSDAGAATEPTDGDGPLSPALVLVAFAVLTAVALAGRRR
jgi:hypothetical protein